MEVMEAIQTRRSHRAYTGHKLTREQIEILVLSGLAAPSAVNGQPWHFTVVEDQALLQWIHDATAEDMLRQPEANRSPRFSDPEFQVFYHAPTVIFISADANSKWAPIDCGIAVENMALAAESLGLGSVILGMPRGAFNGEQKEALSKALQFPENHAFVIAIAVGTPADTKDAHPVKSGLVSYIG